MENATSQKTRLNLGRVAAGFIKQFSIDPARGAVISIKGLAGGEKLLAVGGYLFCAFMLLLGLMLDALSADAEPLKFPYTPAQSIHEMQPFAGLLGVMGYVLAWTFIFTGAGRARKLVFYALLILFAVFAGIASIFAQNFQALCFGPVVLLLLSVLHLAGRRFKLFDRAPVLMFVLIGIVIAINAAMTFFLADTVNDFGLSIYTFFRFVNYLAYPLWMYGGVSLIGFSVALTAGIAKRATGADDPARLIWFAQMAVAAHALIYVVIYVIRLAGEPAIAGQFAPLISVIVSALIALAMFGLNAAKKLTPSAALNLLALSMAFGIFVALVNSMFKLGFNAADPVNAALDKLGILPRGTFFMFTLMVGVLGSFVPFAQGDSPALPHPARVMLALGFAILFIAMMFVFVYTINTADGGNFAGDITFTGLTVFGALAIGIPLTLYSLFARREPAEEMTSSPSPASGAIKALALAFPVIAWLLNRAILAFAR